MVSLILDGEEVPSSHYVQKGERHGYRLRKRKFHGGVPGNTSNLPQNAGIHERDKYYPPETGNEYILAI
jgi:hypothetical protein